MAVEPAPPSRTGAATAADHQVGSFGLQLVLMVASVAMLGTVDVGTVSKVVITVLLGASLVVAFRIARVVPWLMRLAVILAVLGVSVAVVQALTDAVGDGEARGMNALLVAFGPPAMALGVLRNLRESRAVRIEALMGVLSMYMMLGLLFAFVYGAMDRLGGDPFFADGTPATVAKCVYFSFVTLTTTGYGDLVARSDLGHTLAIFEALIGQIYLVTVVSLIVSHMARREPIRP
jgi:hypothetical protein